MGNNNVVWVFAAIVIVGGGAIWWLSNSSSAPTTNVDVTTQENTQPVGTTGDSMGTTTSSADTSTGAVTATVSIDTTPMSATINYDGKSFSPSTVTIKKGGTVTFVNKGSGSMWVASAKHPDHTVYSGTTRSQHCPDTAGTAFDQCANGASYAFTFQKTGEWGYHNHSNASAFGKVIVQ